MPRAPAAEPVGTGRCGAAVRRRSCGHRARRRGWRRQDPCDACPVLCQISRRQARGLRPLRQCRRPADPDRHLRWCSTGAACRLAAAQAGGGRQPRSPTRRCSSPASARHHLSRLQAGAVHRRLAARRRRPGDRGHRGHLQLLQLQGEDRHRPLPRPGAGHGALQGRGGRPCDARSNTARSSSSLGGVHHLTGGIEEGRAARPAS